VVRVARRRSGPGGRHPFLPSGDAVELCCRLLAAGTVGLTGDVAIEAGGYVLNKRRQHLDPGLRILRRLANRRGDLIRASCLWGASNADVTPIPDNEAKDRQRAYILRVLGGGSAAAALRAAARASISSMTSSHNDSLAILWRKSAMIEDKRPLPLPLRTLDLMRGLFRALHWAPQSLPPRASRVCLARPCTRRPPLRQRAAGDARLVWVPLRLWAGPPRRRLG
jgi:hypothetical protein